MPWYGGLSHCVQCWYSHMGAGLGPGCPIPPSVDVPRKPVRDGTSTQALVNHLGYAEELPGFTVPTPPPKISKMFFF